MEPHRVQKHFPRELSALPSLFGFIGDFHTRSFVTERDAREIELIAEELFTNFVRHAGGEHPILVQLERVDDTVHILVRDEGVDEFDLTRVPEPDPERPLEQRRAGGMGITLVRKLAERVSYDYADRTSTVTVVKRLTGGET